MKLDRNINQDGKGKYALINLRKNSVEWGTEPNGQFFVIKYKDVFAIPALRAYAKAVLNEAHKMRRAKFKFEADELYEFEREIQAEIKLAKSYKRKNIPSAIV